MAMLVVSLIFTWIAIAVLALAVLALARQIGVLHERIAPLGALKTDRGPAIGESSPRFSLVALDQRSVEIGQLAPGLRAQLLLFVSPDCPLCKRLIPIAKSFGAQEHLQIIFIGDGEVAGYRRMVERFKLEPFAFVISSDVGIRYGVSKLPYAVLIDERGIIVAAGLVNSREHLESLVVAQESGYRSVQDYLRHLGAQDPETQEASSGAVADS